MDDAKRRDLETEVMSLLEQIAHAVDECEGMIQDDSRITDFRDATGIYAKMLHIRALTIDVEHALEASIRTLR